MNGRQFLLNSISAPYHQTDPGKRDWLEAAVSREGRLDKEMRKFLSDPPSLSLESITERERASQNERERAPEHAPVTPSPSEYQIPYYCISLLNASGVSIGYGFWYVVW